MTSLMERLRTEAGADGWEPGGTRGSALSARHVATALAGIGAAVLVGSSGEPVWRTARVGAVAALAVAVWRAAARRGLAQAVVFLGAGLAAVPVGIGLAGPHLAKDGLTTLSAAGTAMLCGGAWLFAAAVGGLWRSLARRWSVLAEVAAVLSLVVLCWSLGQAVAATNVPRTAVASRTPADLGFAYDDVEFPAADGVALSGWYVPTRNGAALVLLHGAGSTRTGVLAQAGVLARHGYGVLLFDARGHGRSSGRAMDFGWFGDTDVAGAVGFLVRQQGVDASRIGAVGLSMGGEEAVGAAAKVRAIRAVVAEGATNRVGSDKAWLSSAFGARGTATLWVERLTYGFADLLTSARPPITMREAARVAAPRPMLLIAAGDVADEARAARYVQSASPGTVDVWVASGAGHTQGLAAHAAEWESRVVAFLDAALSDGRAR